jgi:hypothetical protein
MSSGGHEILLCRWTWTATGDPLSVEDARREFGPQVVAWTRPGWFFRRATTQSATAIREHGHKAIGESITTWIPPQTAIALHPCDEPAGDYRPHRRPPSRD